MALLTWVLVGIGMVLVGANIVVSRLSRKQNVNVTFLPPAALSTLPSSVEGKVDAHISSVNQKISQLFARMENVEREIRALRAPPLISNDETWLETVPVRKRKGA